MDLLEPPGLAHVDFATWARLQGVVFNGVEISRVKGKGIGVFACRRIEDGEEIVRVPSSALLSIESVPIHFRKSLHGCSIHGTVAAFLNLGGQEVKRYKPWMGSWPSIADFQAVVPMLWSAEVWDALTAKSDPHSTSIRLPPPVSGEWKHHEFHLPHSHSTPLLAKQRAKYLADVRSVSEAFPHADLSKYRYYWSVVNTRNFYYEFYDQEPPKERDDRMVMVPFMDYFNHNDHGCNVAFDRDWYTVTSDRVYEAGEEIYTCYGAHSNDLLLVEYGFVLDENKWDSLPLDDFFDTKAVPSGKRTQLQNAGYLGDYHLDASGVCHRTQVAVRALTMNTARWKRFVKGGEEQDREKMEADGYIAKNVLVVYFEEACDTISVLRTEGRRLPPSVRDLLMRRWTQIRELVRKAFNDSIHPKVQADLGNRFDVP